MLDALRNKLFSRQTERRNDALTKYQALVADVGTGRVGDDTKSVDRAEAILAAANKTAADLENDVNRIGELKRLSELASNVPQLRKQSQELRAALAIAGEEREAAMKAFAERIATLEAQIGSFHRQLSAGDDALQIIFREHTDSETARNYLSGKSWLALDRLVDAIRNALHKAELTLRRINDARDRRITALSETDVPPEQLKVARSEIKRLREEPDQDVAPLVARIEWLRVALKNAGGEPKAESKPDIIVSFPANERDAERAELVGAR